MAALLPAILPTKELATAAAEPMSMMAGKIRILIARSNDDVENN